MGSTCYFFLLSFFLGFFSSSCEIGGLLGFYGLVCVLRYGFDFGCFD